MGWKGIFKIRGIRRCRPLKGKYTIEAAEDLKILHGINLEEELAKMMKIELEEYNNGVST